MKIHFAAPLFLLSLILLVGCSSAPSWLEGTWKVDRDRTQKEMSATDSSSQGSGFFSSLNTMASNMLMAQVGDIQLIVTGKDRVSMVNGQGKSESYQIVNKSSDQCTLKFKDGTVETYYRAGDDIYTYPTGGAHFKIYLARQN